MSIATCGHAVDHGITTSVDEGCYDGAVTYGTYCNECVLEYHKNGQSLNSELNKILSQLTRTKAALDVAKEALEKFVDWDARRETMKKINELVK